jgi:hydrogenase maturation protease
VRADVGAGSLPPEITLASTHALGVGQALELGRALGRAPGRVVLLGVEGAAFAMGDPMTPAVEAALDEVVTRALAELSTEEPCTSAR